MSVFVAVVIANDNISWAAIGGCVYPLPLHVGEEFNYGL